MSGNRRFSDALKTLDFRKDDKPLYFSGMLGTIINGVSVIHIPSRPGFVWVRLRSVSNELIQAYNSLVSPIYDLPVIVERDPLDPTRYSIIGRDVGRYDSWGVANSPAYTNPVYQITYYPNFYNDGVLVASSGTVIDFGENINVAVTGSAVFISAVDTRSVVIYDGATYKVTGTALNFADNLSVVVTGSTAYVSVATGVYALASHSHSLRAYDLIIYEDGVFKATGTAINFGENLNVAVTGSTVFVSSVDTTGGGADLLIYDDSTFKVTGTAINFGSNLEVVVTGSTAFVWAVGGGFSGELPIFDGAVYKATGTAISFGDNLDVVVTGTTAFVSLENGLDWAISGNGYSSYGNHDPADWDHGTDVGGGGSGRTIITNGPDERIRQDGYISKVSVYLRQAGTTMQIKFKVFRKNGSNYDFISESETLTMPPGTGEQKDFYLTSPMECQIGDTMGLWLPSGGMYTSASTLATGSFRYTDGDITTSNTFSTVSSGYLLDIAAYGPRPWICVSGDSIAEGHNCGISNYWHSFYHDGIAGTRTSEIANSLRVLIPNLEYQNHAYGGETFAWVASTGIVSAAASLPRAIFIHCGINDVIAARTWEAVEDDLNTILSISGDVHLFIDEILPYTDGNDTQAGTIRTWNGNLATWCSSNGATLVRCHDQMAQTRVSTGLLDDLLAAYDEDGTHLTQAGVNKLAAIWKASLDEYYDGAKSWDAINVRVTGSSSSQAESLSGISIYDNSVFKTTGTAISFDTNLDVSVTGSVAFVRGTFTPNNSVPIFDNGVYKATGTAIDFGANLGVVVTGSNVYVSALNYGTYFRVGQPLWMDGQASWQVPDQVYASGSLAVFIDGEAKRPGIDYAEMFWVSGTYRYLIAPATGTYHLVMYGVPLVTQIQPSTGTESAFALYDSDSILLLDSDSIEIVDSEG